MIDFPANPTVGQTIQVGGCIYTCVSINPAVWSARISTSGIPDAPVDDRTYGRRNGAWEFITKATIGLSQVDNTSDANKPISTATANALAGKEPSIAASTAANYWRGDKTFQPLNPGAVGAVAKAGDTMTGNLRVPAVYTSAVINDAARLLLQSNQTVDVVNVANNTWMPVQAGSFVAQTGGLTLNQYGAISWPNNVQIYQDPGGGNVVFRTYDGTLRYPNFGSNGYLNSPGVNTGVINATGRITSTIAGDVAALYSASASSGIYTEGNGSASFRSTAGGITITGNGSRGVNFTTYAPEGGYSNVYGLLGNPNWNQVQLQLSHQHGVWAGARFLGGTNEIQFVMSNAGGWGSVRAASFEVQSDERIKRDVSLLGAQHAAFMAIKPISWKSPIIEMPEPVPLEIENIDGTFVEFPPPSPRYGDPEKLHFGFSAQNLTTAFKAAVQGEVDAVDEDGKIVPAGVNPVPIIALTVLEVQALWDKIAELEARLPA